MFPRLAAVSLIGFLGCSSSSEAPPTSDASLDTGDPGDVIYADDPVTTRVDDGVDAPDVADATATDGGKDALDGGDGASEAETD